MLFRSSAKLVQAQQPTFFYPPGGMGQGSSGQPSIVYVCFLLWSDLVYLNDHIPTIKRKTARNRISLNLV